MKIILSIIIMFLSAQSFADLKGKGLICFIKKPWEQEVAFKFYAKFKYDIWHVERIGDKYFLKKMKGTNKYSIYSSWLSIEYRTWKLKINRKNLRILFSGDVEGYCKATKSHKEVIDELHTAKDLLQRKYDEKIKGNKI